MSKKHSPTSTLRHQILTLTTKLTDKDTHSHSFSLLQTLIPTLTPSTFSLFITSLSSLSATLSSSRASTLRLLAALTSAHAGASLSPHLPKLISAVARHIRDPDSTVRAAAASLSAAIAANIAASFSALFRSLSDALATEQEASAQSAAAKCLAEAIEAAAEVERGLIARNLTKWMRMVKCEGFQAKAGVVMVIKSAIRVCEIGKGSLLRDLVDCLVEVLRFDDWQARKAAAIALIEIGEVERENLVEVKVNCLKIFESRRFDKVKAVREVMTQMLEVWKEIPDVFDDGSPPPHSQLSSKENVSDGRILGRSKISSGVESNTPHTRRHASLRRSSPSDSALKTTTGNKGTLDSIRKKPTLPVNVKLAAYEDIPVGDDDGVSQRGDLRPMKPETRRGLFSKNCGSRVMQYPDERSEATVAVSSTSADTCKDHKDCEDLSEIRKQLVQIENQQSNLMDLLQKFIGSSEDGMRTLETRVHGLERALDDVSYDLAVSTARMSAVEAARTSCCLPPGSNFLSPRFWRRPEGRCSTSRLSFSGNTPSSSALCRLAGKSCAIDPLNVENIRYRVRGAGGVIVNPLADIHGDSRGISEASSSGVVKTLHNIAAK